MDFEVDFLVHFCFCTFNRLLLYVLIDLNKRNNKRFRAISQRFETKKSSCVLVLFLFLNSHLNSLLFAYSFANLYLDFNDY